MGQIKYLQALLCSEILIIVHIVNGYN